MTEKVEMNSEGEIIEQPRKEGKFLGKFKKREAVSQPITQDEPRPVAQPVEEKPVAEPEPKPSDVLEEAVRYVYQNLSYSELVELASAKVRAIESENAKLTRYLKNHLTSA